MQTRNRLTKNLFETRQSRSFDPNEKSVVFISYRHVYCDTQMARQCAEILEAIPELHYWFDEEDKCLANAQSEISDINIATCIEKGLDAASALLGIIGPETFNSSWIPYEIGGARGRQSFSKNFTSSPPDPHPLIAHLIHDTDISNAPDFVSLGIPLQCLCEVEQWAKYIAKILKAIQEAPFYENILTKAQHLQDTYGIQEIYERNTHHLRYQ